MTNDRKHSLGRSGGILIALFYMLGAMMVHTPAWAQGPEAVLYQENFDDGQAQGWELEPGWRVIQDGDNWVLAGEGHQWARPGPSYASDFRVQFRLKLQQGRIHLVYRLNQTGRYFIGFQEDRSDLNKQYWPETFLDRLAGGGVPHSLGTWHQVEIVGQGASLRFLVDGQVEWEYTDPDPLLGGSFAFETLDDSVAYIDDILVYGPAPTPTPTPDRRFTWVRTGGPLGGLGYDVRMRPDNPDIMYVTDAWAGVFMSTDGGQTWFPSNEGITTRTGESGDAIPVFCLTIDPHDDDTIWIGTQNVRGIYKSADSGRSWVEMDNGVVEREGITFRGFTVDPRSSDIVYAAAEISSWAWAGEERSGREFDLTQGVVYKTTDGGQNWTAVWRGDNLARYVWIDPRNPDVVYVSTGIFDREAANSIPDSRTPGGVGIVKSTDGGQTWAEVNHGLANLYVGTLFMHPENPAVLLAGTGNNQYYDRAGVYLSADGGDSWQQTLTGENINAVEFALSQPDIAYAGSANTVYRSEDGARTWQRVSGGENGWGPPGVRAGFPIDFQVDPRNPDRIFANNYGGGNFLSTDGGHTWTVASQGYTGAQTRDIAVDPTAAGRVLAAARSGLFVSTDGGNEWAGLSYPPAASLEWYVVAVDPTDPQHVLAANNWNGVILQSHDRGRTWRAVSQRPDENMSWRAIAFAPSDPATVYAGTSAFFSAGTFDDRMSAGGIYVSHDGGTTWSRANDTLSQDANVTSLAVGPHGPQVVYAATSNHGLLKSTNGGLSWTALNQGLPGTPAALSVAIHPADTNVIYAGLWRGGLYRSEDGGETWQPSAAGLNPEASVSDIVFDPTNPQVVYAADRFSGVYRSTDGGAAWTPVNVGLRTRAVNALAISSDGQHLYAATEGEGVFRLDLSGQPPQAAPTPVLPTATPTLAPTPELPTPTAVAVAPTAIPSPVEPTPPTATPTPTIKPSSGRGICGGIAAWPLALLGLVVIRRRLCSKLKERSALPIILVVLTALACSLQVSPPPTSETPAAVLTLATGETPSPTAAMPTPAPGHILCPDPQPPLVTDLEVHQTPDLPEPPPRVPFRDPVFGTCLVRVTDRKADLSPEDPSAGLKNEYSRVQSFNADGSRILVRSIEANWYLYDADTLQPLGQLPLSVEPRWDASNPDLLYYSEETRLMAYNVRSGEQSLVHDFAADFPGRPLAAVWTRYEGSPSLNSRYWGLMAENQDWETVALLVYDRVEDRVIATRDMREMSQMEREIDTVTISSLGNYFLAYHDEYCEPGQLGDDAHPCGLMVYDRDLKHGRGLLRIVGHSDPALDAQGREVLIYQDIDTDHISMLDLGSGTVTPLWPIDFSHTPIGLHFSGRAFKRPGWALVSTYSGGHPTDYTWMDDQVFAVELKPGGRVVRLAHTHSLVDETQEHDYWAEPHASVNPDFTRAVFTSNWGRSGTGEVEMFMLELPPDWTEQLP